MFTDKLLPNTYIDLHPKSASEDRQLKEPGLEQSNQD